MPYVVMSLSRVIFSVVLLSWSFGLLANPSKFSSEDIFQLEYVNTAEISPDGSKIIYSRSAYDIMSDSSRRSLWLYDLKADKHTPLFADQYSYNQVNWSPQSDKFAFVSNRDGGNQIYVHWLQDNKTALVTQVRKGVSNISWSPDAQWLAFTMDVPEGKSDFSKSVYFPKKPKGARWADKPTIIERARYQSDGRGFLEPAYRHVFIVPATGGTARQLTRGEFQHSGPLAWHPEGTAVVFASNRRDDWEYDYSNSDLYQVDVKTSELRQITNQAGTETTPKFSPDGKTLAYLSRSDAKVPYKNTDLVLQPLNSGKAQNISSNFDRMIADFGWYNGDELVIQYDDKGKRVLAKISQSGKIKRITDALSGTTLGRPYISGRFSVASNGAIAFTRGSSQRPADLGYWYRGKVKQLTHINDDLLAHRALGKVHSIEYASSHDGEKIQGWYITPPDFDPSKKYPLLLEIHGGPHLAYGPHFTAELQRYAAEGFVVFYANHRGSTSYGERFAMLLKFKYSSDEDFADHNSGVDAMIAKGFIDQNNLFIAGGSAGGIASAYAVGLTDRFSAAAITKPVINWISKVLTADSYIAQISHQFPGVPWEHMEHYWKRSPLSLVGNVTTPSLIMTGEADRRTPISESEQFYQALKLRKIDTALVRIPGSPHGIAGKPSRMIAKIEHSLAWFKRYLK